MKCVSHSSTAKCSIFISCTNKLQVLTEYMIVVSCKKIMDVLNIFLQLQQFLLQNSNCPLRDNRVPSVTKSPLCDKNVPSMTLPFYSNPRKKYVEELIINF